MKNVNKEYAINELNYIKSRVNYELYHSENDYKKAFEYCNKQLNSTLLNVDLWTNRNSASFDIAVEVAVVQYLTCVYLNDQNFLNENNIADISNSAFKLIKNEYKAYMYYKNFKELNLKVLDELNKLITA